MSRSQLLSINPEKDDDEESKEKSLAVKLTTTLEGAALPNPIFNQGTMEQYLK
jgi:hypothetical protein